MKQIPLRSNPWHGYAGRDRLFLDLEAALCEPGGPHRIYAVLAWWISADGPKNLFDAIPVAVSPKSKGRGVTIDFNEGIFDAREVMNC